MDEEERKEWGIFCKPSKHLTSMVMAEQHKEILNNLGLDMTTFNRLYEEFEHKYNPYPVQMSRAEAFGNAFKDGLIDEEIYKAAREYYGSLWFYVGD